MTATNQERNAKPSEDLRVFEAASQGDLEAIEALLRDGAPASTRSFDGQTPLMAAVKLGRADCVRRLLGVCDPLALTHQEQDALDIALSEGKAECVKILAPVSDNRPDRRAQRLRDLINKHNNPRALDCMDAFAPTPDDVRNKGPAGMDALMLASMRRKMGMLERLLPLGDPSSLSDDGRSAFDYGLPAPFEVRRPSGYACADRLAETVSAEKLRKVVEALGAEHMPRAAALIEAWDLRAVADQAANSAGGAAFRAAPSAAANKKAQRI